MKKRSVSSKDVALAAGVSRTTVSFVLNATPGKLIPEETRKRVLEAAAALGYEPDLDAARLAKSARFIIGLVVRHSASIYSDAYIVRLIEGMAPVLNRKRCGLVLLPCGATSRQADILDLVRSAGCDGVMITNTLEDDAGVPALSEAGIPSVVIGTVQGSVWQIDIDNRAAARLATMHLIEAGHKKIAMIVHAPSAYHAARERLAGFRSAIAHAGLSDLQCPVLWADFSEESGRLAMQQLLSQPLPPSAVFAGNDAIAYGAYQAVRDAGLNIPGNISIIGFDDDFPSRFLFPPLSTISLPAAALGERAAEMIVELVNGTTPGERRIVLPTQLVERASCAAPAAGVANE